jgi:hypothetical protein
MTNISLDVTGYYFNHWPFLKVIINDLVIFDNEIVNHQILNFDVDCVEHNQLRLIHYGKRYNDNNVWDTDGKNDCYLNINDIRFEGVELGIHLKSQLEFVTHWRPFQLSDHSDEFINQHSRLLSNGMMTFNGEIVLDFETPVLNWLTIKKFRVPINEDVAYFSNHSARWHYTQDLKLINNIKQLMNFNENSHS